MASDLPVEKPWHNRRTELFAVLAVFAFALILGLAAVVTGGREHLVQLARAHWAVIVGLLGLSLINYFARGLRWHLFSRNAEVVVPLHRSLLYFVSGFSMTMTPGKIGEVLRLWLLRRHYGYAYVQTTPLLVADRVSDLAAILLLCFAGVAAFTNFLPVLVGLLAAMAGVMLLMRRPFLLMRGLDRAQLQVRRFAKPIEAIKTFVGNLSSVHAGRLYAITLPLALVGWLAEAAGFYWLLATLGTDVSFLQSLFVFGFAMLVGAVSFLPGGIGGTEATMAALLTALGVELDVAIVATAVIRFTTLWFAVVLGLVVLAPALRPPSQSAVTA